MERDTVTAMRILAAALLSVPALASAQPYVSAHRGGAAYAPENTMMAFRNAARLHVDDFETDSWLSADGALVLIHDQDLSRTTNCKGPVTAKTWAELRECDAGWWFTPGQGVTHPDPALPHPARGRGARIPSAKELFAFAASFQGDYRPTVTIEIKDKLAAVREAEALVPLIQNSDIKNRIIVQSFSRVGIDRVKQLDPSIRTLYLVDEPGTLRPALIEAVHGGHDFIAPDAGMAGFDAAYVQVAHDAGRKVVPWTIDTQADVQRMVGYGVDGIISNFPACLLKLEGRLTTARLMPEELGEPDAPLCRR
ncbi:glycerophosphodiester phosphodiesterase [Solimonas marina]|uniref:GP-PDE domain-containing protein n=1 Tax=Solimonas marina TaxID=2714601 RepID=A0A970B7Y9_9GAMM|nr:glycerophosphodiester phosphodiesterase family protein [Solimonas marina]NKF21729.1 hypothetical protein [Solimonas marina]